MDIKKIVAFPDTVEVRTEELPDAFKYARKLIMAPRGGRDAVPVPASIQGLPVTTKLRRATKNELFFFMGYVKAKAEMAVQEEDEEDEEED